MTGTAVPGMSAPLIWLAPSPLVGGGVYAWMSTRPDPNAVSYVTQVVERGPISVTVSADGTFEPDAHRDLGVGALRDRPQGERRRERRGEDRADADRARHAQLGGEGLEREGRADERQGAAQEPKRR